MNELIRFAWDVLTFKHEAYAGHVGRADVMRRGLTLLVLVTLVAGTVPFIIEVVNGLRPQPPPDIALKQLREIFEQLGQYFPDLPDLESEILPYMRPQFEMAARIARLPTPLPKPLGVLLTAFGAFVSRPLARMAAWLAYGIWVLLFAKLLGGRATAAQMLGCTALYAVPHVFDILGPVPCLGDLIGLVTAIWGIAIYVKALDVASGLGTSKAVLAAVLPVLLQVAAAVLLGIPLLIGFIAMLSQGA
jgi:hypothetical protein